MKTVLCVLARLMFMSVFLGSGMNKITDIPGTVSMMQEVDMPMPGLLVYGAIVFLLIGGISVLAGFKARFGAAFLMVFLVLATYYFHDFWNHPGDETYTIDFMHNLALFGALLFVMVNGPGPGSVDECCGGGKSRETTSEAAAA